VTPSVQSLAVRPPEAAETATDEVPRPVVGVQAAVFREDQILLQQRRNVFGDGSWGLPGGHLEFGESFEDAAARELLEETGLTAKHLKTVIPQNTAYETTHYVQIAVEVLAWEGDPIIREPDRCAGLAFFDPRALPFPLFEPSREILDHLLFGRIPVTSHRLHLELAGDGHWTSLKLHGSLHPVVVAQTRSREEGWRLRSRSDTLPDLASALQWVKRQLYRRLTLGDHVKTCDGDLPLDLVLRLFPPEHPVAVRPVKPEGMNETKVDQLALFVESELG
jgi:8-oxo-dGTP diphosphatase